MRTRETSRLKAAMGALDGGICITALSCPKPEPLHGRVLGSVRGWYHTSLLRLILRQSRSAAHHIWLSRCRPTVLNYAEIRQSLPQVPCSGNRNEMQFCSTSIQKLCAERPYLTFADCRLFVEGFFLAGQWYAHLGRQYRSGRQR